MTTTGSEPVPWPPKDCGELSLKLVDGKKYLGSDPVLYRVGVSAAIAIGDGILDVLPRKAPAWRFDCPMGERRAGRPFLVLYASTTRLGAYVETFASGPIVTPAMRVNREVGAIQLARPLRLVDFHSPAVLGVFNRRLDEGICTLRQYRLSQAWAAAVHRCAPDADGITYRARRAGEVGTSFALFLDRARDALVRLGPSVSVDDPSLDSLHREFTEMTGIPWG